MELKFPKLYRYDRIAEHCHIAIPFAKGVLKDIEGVQILQDGKGVPIQKKVTSYYEDGSVRYLFARFMANLPANQRAVLTCVTDSTESAQYQGITVEKTKEGYQVKGGVSFIVHDHSEQLFEELTCGTQKYIGKQFVGPVLADDEGEYNMQLGTWRVREAGPLVAILCCNGVCIGSRKIAFELKVTAYAEKPWIEISYRIINTSNEQLPIASLVFALKANEDAPYQPTLNYQRAKEEPNATSHGDTVKAVMEEVPVYETTGILRLPQIQEAIDVKTVRTCVGHSNYKTKFSIAREGIAVERVVDAKYLVDESNEHFAEVLYGTFFTDRTDETGGVCATIYQAQQNYPKAVKADDSGIYVMLVPKDVDKVVMEPGMSREQRFLLHFHAAEESLVEIDNRSLIYQMPDRPYIAPEIFKEAGVMPDIFVDRNKINDDVELSFIGICDGHARAYGMLNWGDSPDQGYTTQGRGRGRLVWGNNEYDFPHACALLYARTGERRFMDYMLVACSHWMDVDICHYSDNPLHVGGQWEHTVGHCVDGSIVCSHEWVEGLLDYYHFSGDERGLETALNIGENVLHLLETPMFKNSGESSARETGWALRTLVALYTETCDKKWLTKCDWILGHFKDWASEYGEWIYPYTDNTMIRVGFMISVAMGSIMRYYRLFPSAELKDMLLNVADDLIENCYLENGVFSYKELPSLNRIGNNSLLLEAMTIAYELSGDKKYLTYGKRTFLNNIKGGTPAVSGPKSIVEDAVIQKMPGTKHFAQSFIPMSVYYKALADNNML